MRKIQNGEPVFHQHECSEERRGQVMTPEEMHAFAVQVLMKEYELTGAKVYSVEKVLGNEADFRVEGKRNSKKFNVIVVCRDRFTRSTEGIDDSWMLKEYEEKGVYPRVTEASPWCDDEDCENGEPYICGAEFAFIYNNLSLIPYGEIQFPEKELSDVKLAVKLMDAWRKLDVSVIEPHLWETVHYGSDWVFDEIPCKAEFLEYLRGKFYSIRKSGDMPEMFLVRSRHEHKVGILFNQSGHTNLLKLDCAKGFIINAHMGIYEKGYEEFDPADELYQNHGDHFDAIMDVNEFFSGRLQEVISQSKLWRTTRTLVCNEDLKDVKANVYSLRYGEGDMGLLNTIILNRRSQHQEYASSYPVLEGSDAVVTIDKVIEWDNRLEATVMCSCMDREFAFFAVDYYANKDKYVVGSEVTVSLAALAMKVEEAQREFAFEGQQAVDWLAKIGQEPELDENGDVRPVRFSMEKLVAYIPHDSRCPDEAEFQSPVGKISATSILDVPFYRTDIAIIKKEDDDSELRIPMYFRKDFLPEVKEDDPVRGWVWLTGELSGQHGKMENGESSKLSIPEKADDFRDILVSRNWRRGFDNLMDIIATLPELKIRDGYEFDAFKCGDDMGWEFQTYCCKAGSELQFEDGMTYDDAHYIQDLHDAYATRDVKPAIGYFEVPFTEEGIFQAWLLDNAHEFMPRYWHANYNVKDFIFQKEDLENLFEKEDGLCSRESAREETMALDPAGMLPKVTVEGDTAWVEYTYWNDWKGLVKARTKAVRYGSGISFDEPELDVLVMFDCLINF